MSPLLQEAAALLSGPAADFDAACDAALREARAALVALKAAPRGDASALVAYDRATARILDTSARAALARNVSPELALRTAAEKWEQAAEALAVEMSLDRAVYDALRAVDVSSEDGPTRKWMEKTLREFRRAGVDRDEATRARIKELNEELVRLGQEFSRNINDDVRRVPLDPGQLAGLPADYLATHLPGPDGKVVITTDYPDLIPLLQFAQDPAAREALWRAARMRAYPANLEVLDRILERRHELATLLGYPSWAAYATENKMVKSAQAARDFIERVAALAEKRAHADYQALLERKRRDNPGAERLDPWDQGYYETLVKAERFGFDAHEVRSYFEYGRVKQGVMDTTARMFGIEWRPVSSVQVWHADVETWDVLDETGELLGRIHLDMHPREGKYKHAAQFTLTHGQAGQRLPEGVLVCNFPRPGTQPALLTHEEVETFFHEFGHLLHHVLGGRQRWTAIGGVSTEWDFVEVPSMLLQEWPSDPGTLALFARHHQSGQAIPEELVRRMRAARGFGKGMHARRQMALAMISLDFHDRAPGFETTRRAAEILERYTPFRHVEGTYFQCSFGHLEGYSALYYTYMWSVVIARDLQQEFERNGYLDRETAMRYRREVLEPGGSKDADDLVAGFLGRPYELGAFERWLDE